VSGEIARRKESARRRNQIDADSLIADFERLEATAIEKNQMTAAVKAREAIGRVCGLLDVKHRVNINVDGDVVVSHDEALSQALTKSREQMVRLKDVSPS
jgi:hypothetical protein